MYVCLSFNFVCFAFAAVRLPAMGALVLFDVAGLLFKFTNLGHAAHLGGMAFGAWYVCVL